MAGSIFRRKSLFGTVTDVPQDNILDAEEEYGYVSDGPILEAEEDYSSVFGGGYTWYGAEDDDILDDEEDYVDDIDLDDEEYLDDLDEDDDEDDDEEAMGYYGADSDVQLEGELAELEAEIDEDLEFGAWYGRGPLTVPGPARASVQDLADALNLGAVLPSWLQSQGATEGWIEWGVENLNDLVTNNETREIAKYLMNEPGFASWNSLSEEQQAQMVANAVAEASWMGIEMQGDDPLRQALNAPTLFAKLSEAMFATPRAFWNFVSGDVPRMTAAALSELGIRGPGGALVDDQMINGLAIRYRVIGFIYPNIYRWLADSVTRQGQSAITAVQQTTQDLGSVVQPGAPTVPHVQPPPRVLPTKTAWPTPAQIIGIGLGITTGGAVLGVFE